MKKPCLYEHINSECILCGRENIFCKKIYNCEVFFLHFVRNKKEFKWSPPELIHNYARFTTFSIVAH